MLTRQLIGSVLGVLGMPTSPQGPPSARPTSTAARISRKGAVALLGRYQGPENFFQQAFTALNAPVIPRAVNLTRPLESFKIVWRGRVVLAVAAISPIASEAPQTIINRIRITGTHTRFNQLAPLDISGATLFTWGRLFQFRSASLIINGARQPDPTMPFQQVTATFGNTGTYDIEIHYHVPLTPQLGPGDSISTAPYLWYPQDWADTIQVQLFFGDGTSFGTLGTTTVTFTAFNSGSGSPVVGIYTNYAIMGALANSVQAGVVVRNEQTQQGGPVAAIANNVRLQVLQKQRTLNVLIKSGTILTGTSGGVTVYASLLDTMLDFTQLVVDNKPIRNNFANHVAKEYSGWQFNAVSPQGYLIFTFVDSLNPTSMLRGDLIPGGSVFELDSNVLTNTANQAISVIQEQVFGDPKVRAA